MISLTRLNGQAIAVNEANILWVEALPDTSIMLLSGERLLVQESVEEVCLRVNRVSCLSLPSTCSNTPQSVSGHPACCSDSPLGCGSSGQGVAEAGKR